MKETKVYVDELPDICDECPFQNKTTYECVLLPKYNKQPFLQSCPLKSLREYDKELVEKVCDKIKLKFSDARSHNWGIEQIELYDFLDQIQKEVEDGE